MVPTLWVVSIVAFMLSNNVPQDPVTAVLQARGLSSESNDQHVETAQYDEVYRELGRDQPLFYFSILPHHYPRNINIHSGNNLKERLVALLKEGYAYDSSIDLLQATTEFYNNNQGNNQGKNQGKNQGNNQGNNQGQAEIEAFYRDKNLEQLDKTNLMALKPFIHNLKSSQSTFFLPKFFWHGCQNQYHLWFSQAIKGHFGPSFMHNTEASGLVKKALTWTGILSLFDILFSFFWGIIAAYFIAKNPSGFKEKTLSKVLYFLYAMPAFWLATLCVLYFTTDDYGTWTNIFPSVGINIYPEKSTLCQVLYNWPKLLLPVLVMSVSTITFIAKILSQSIHNEMAKPYILTAYSKGLTPAQALRRHALPNALYPLITLLAGALPRSLAGTVVIEVIFNIPGIGRLMYESIGTADWNVVFCIMMFLAIITMLSYLMADMLYALTNPKVRYA